MGWAPLHFTWCQGKAQGMYTDPPGWFKVFVVARFRGLTLEPRYRQLMSAYFQNTAFYGTGCVSREWRGFGFERQSHVSQAGLKPYITKDLERFVRLPNAEITYVCHHAWFMRS